jgi:hypothetical protein
MSAPSSRTFVWDTQRPDVCVSCVIAQTSTQLLVQFTETVDAVTSQILNNYQVVSSGVFPIAAARNIANPSQVLLTFATPFPLEVLHQLRIRNVQDLAGNVMITRTRDFMYDTNPPSVVELRVMSNTSLRLRFSEFVQNPSATTLTNYSVSAGIGNPSSAVLFAPDPRYVTLTFATPFGDLDGLILTVSNVRDLTNNPLSPPQNIPFSAKNPSIASVKVLADNQLQITFSEPVSAASATLLSAYTLAGVGTCTSAIHAGAVVTLTFSGTMNIGTNYNLQCNNIADLFGNVSVLLSETVRYQPRITAVVPISLNLLDVVFESEVNLTDAQTLSKYDVLGFGTPVAAVRDAAQLNLVHLTFGTNFTPNTNYTLQAGWFDLENGFTAPVSRHNFLIDTQPPTIVNVTILSATMLELEFSEAVNEVTAEAINHYNVLGFGIPLTAVRQSNPKFVRLTFANPFEFGVTYVMTVQSVRDLQGNTMTTQNVSFARPTPPTFRQLLITEIMSDPDPQVGLPNYEYIEIYNNSPNPINLLGVRIQDATGFGTLGNYVLPAGQYLTLCGSSAFDSLSLIGATLRVTSFPSLSNTGEILRLVSPTGTVIDEVTYSSSWHDNAVKRDGGWSLERKSLESSCTANNWASSIDIRGGTPSLVNSINGTFSDNNAPKMTVLTVSLPSQLTVNFNEDADSLSLVNPAHYNFSPSLPIASLTWQSRRSVRFTFSTVIDGNTRYRLIANGIKDCANNTGADTAFFAVGTRPLYGELLINEIMADEDPPVGLPRAEYIELYNRSSKLINLRTVRLSDASATITLPNVAMPANSYLTLTSTTRADSMRLAVIAAGGTASQVLGVTSFPSLANTGERLTLRDTSGNLIHTVDYKDTWYGDAVKKNGGWSLEMIDPTNICGEANNWRASNDPRGGTPSKVNSVFAPNPDNAPPAVTLLEIVTLSQIRLVFNENLDSLQAVNPANYTVSGLTISGVVWVSQKEVLINFTSPMSETVVYTLTVRVRDCAGNTANQTLQFGRGRMPMPGELIINEIMADETPKVGMPLCEWIEIHNRTNDLLSLDGVRLSDATGNATLPRRAILPNDFMILCSTSRIDSFAVLGVPQSKVVGVTSFPSLNNTGEPLVLRNRNGQILHSVEYSDSWYGDPVKKNGGWTLELIDKNFACVEEGNWRASTDPRGGTPAAENSIAAANPDTTPPLVLQLNGITSTLLELVFNEKADSLTMTNPTNYQIDNGISVTRIDWINEKTLQMQIAPATVPNVIYTLRVRNIKDCSGNAMTEQVLTFGTGIAPEKFDVLITEIHADPSPVVALPDREFIEIHNRSAKIIGLKNIVLQDGGGETTLPDAILRPGEYVVLCSESSVPMFAPFGRALGVKSFPSLSNEGEKLTLKTKSGAFIHSVEYSPSWYQDAVKSQGGWTLEMIDTNNPCGEANNWRGSTDPRGGTPAQVNSINGANPDNDLPTIVALNVLNNTTLEIIFSETTDSLTMVTVGNYAIDKGISVTSVQYASPKSAQIQISPAISLNILYTLTARNVRDCSGNIMTEQQILFGTGATPQKNELIITEILADPTPVVNLPESEFLEIHNRSDKILSLGNVILTDNLRSVRLPFLTILPKQYIILCPNSSVSAFRSFGTVIGLPTWTTLDNNGEKLVLSTTDGEKIFEVSYSLGWYDNDFKRDGGWSLEMIDTDNPCTEAGNWRPSTDIRGGTPGRENSVKTFNPDNRPPGIVRAYASDSETVFVEFDEKIDELQLLNFSELTFDKAVTVVERAMPTSVLLRLKVSPALLPTTIYNLTLKNVRDCGGNLMSEKSVRIVLPENAVVGDVIINEILSNPPVGGVDFVEIYNRSEKFINLQNWSLASWRDDALYTPRVITTQPFILAPGEYLAISRDNEQLLRQYPNGAYERFFQVSSIPAYADASGSVILLAPNGEMIDRVDYSNKWHFSLIRDQNNVSLERIDFFAPSNDPNNWTSAASDVGFGTPGYINSQHLVNREKRQSKDCFSLSHEVITPDGDGIQDFTQIQLSCEEPNLSANITIFDMQGCKLRDLLTNRTISPLGYITWDGTDNAGKRVPIGYYLIAVELFNATTGNTNKVFLKVAVGER